MVNKMRQVLDTDSNIQKNQSQNVYTLIANVAGELSNEGIKKTQRSTMGGGFNFRGIDDVYNAVGPLLAKHGLVIMPRCVNRECVERVSGNGKALFYVTVSAEFDFISSNDESKHTVSMFGEAMDSGDKATNKAMSAAYKYAIFQTFCIPVEGDNDADASTHTVKPKVVESLTDEQESQIIDLATEVGADLETLTNFYKVKTVSDVPQAAFPAIIRSLKKKRKK